MPTLHNGISSPLPFGSLCHRPDRGISKLSLRKQNKICMISTSSSSPYLFKADDPIGCWRTVKSFSVYDPRKREMVMNNKIPDQTLWTENVAESSLIGTSRGWICLKHVLDFTVHLTNIFNPVSSSHKLISLPPLTGNDSEEDRIISRGRDASVSLSCPPDQDGCVVALKSDVPYVSLCRLGDSEWTHLKIPSGLDSSRIAYSDRDGVFYLDCDSDADSGRWSIAHSYFPPVIYRERFPIPNPPKLNESKRETKSNYLVESPSGELFNVFRFEQRSGDGIHGPYKTKRFMVFRKDSETGEGIQTEDIGDLCIFVDFRGGVFCVGASTYPGLIPNSVYYLDRKRVGIYELGSGSNHGLRGSFSNRYGEFWLAPLEQSIPMFDYDSSI